MSYKWTSEEITWFAAMHDAQRAAEKGRCGTALRGIVNSARMGATISASTEAQRIGRTDFDTMVSAFERGCVPMAKLSGLGKAPKRKTSRKSRKK